MSVRQRIREYTGGVANLNSVLIITFGCILTGIGIALIRGQRRMEQRQAVALAALRAQAEQPPEPVEAEPGQRHIWLVPPVAVLAAIAVELRRHWVRTVSAAGGALAATAVVLGLLLGHQPTPAEAGPPQAGQPTTASLTGATVPRTAGSAVSSPPAQVSTAPGVAAPVPTTSAATVVVAAEAPVLPPPTVAPPSTLPVPSRSPSAPGTTPAPTGQPTPAPSSSTPCLLAMNATPILGVCLL